MKNRAFILLLLSTIPFFLKAQKTENEKEIYWQPDKKLNFQIINQIQILIV